MRWLVALVLMATLGGCIESEEGFEASATQIQRIALQMAHEWADRPVLVGIRGFEILEGQRHEASEELGGGVAPGGQGEDLEAGVDSTIFDTDVGNGRAPWWDFEFQDADQPGRELGLSLRGDGKVLNREETGGSGSLQRGLRPWKVDSDEAMRLARQANESFDRLARAADLGGIFYHDEDPDDAPYWELGLASGEEGFHDIDVYVDALDGRLMEVHVFGDLVPTESGQVMPSFQGVETEATGAFTLEEEGHPGLFLVLEGSSVVGFSVDVVVDGPSGASVAIDGTTAGPTATSYTSAFLADPGPGEWRVRFIREYLMPADIVLHWCAVGTASDSCP